MVLVLCTSVSFNKKINKYRLVKTPLTRLFPFYLNSTVRYSYNKLAFIIQTSDINPRACEFCKAHAYYVPVRQIRGRRNINIMGGNYSAMDPMEVPVPDIEVLFQRDGYLKPYEREIRRR